MDFKPWDHQQKAFDAIEKAFADGYKKVCFQLGTGGGKTGVIRMLVEHHIKNKKVIYITAHRKNLVGQLSKKIDEAGVRHGIVGNGYPFIKYRVQVCSIQTLYRRIDKLPYPDLILPDEFHHYTAKTFSTIFTKWEDAHVCGFTATPRRPDGTPLNKICDFLICGPSNKYLIDNGYLSEYDYYAPDVVDMTGIHMRAGDYVDKEVMPLVDNKKIIGSAIEHYKKYADHEKAIVCCQNIKHAEDQAEAFREAGYKFYAIHSNLKDNLIDNYMKSFSHGETEGLVQCNLIGEGIDIPGAKVLIDVAPTMSEIKYLQDRGRVLRKCNGKNRAIILDHVGNFIRHGLPDDDREWNLESINVKEKCKSKYKRCPRCLQPVPIRQRICDNLLPPLKIETCGYQWTETAEAGTRQPEEHEGELIQIAGNGVSWDVWNRVMSLKNNVDK